MVRTAPSALLAGCVWIAPGELEERLDADRDGVPGSVDCNDEDEAVAVLEPVAEVACGASVSADAMDGDDALDVANCVSPFDEEDLLVLGLFEHVYRFSSDAPVDVEVRLLADDLWLRSAEAEDDAVALVANRGPRCEVGSCEVGLPAATARSPEGRGTWRPSVQFHAAAAEGWYLVVSGGRAGTAASPYTLDVLCEE